MAAKDQKHAAVADEDDCPDLEVAEQQQELPQAGKQTKKYAKAMAKLGLKPESGVARVNIRKSTGPSFAIVQPEVYRFPTTNTFVMFGETQLDESSQQQQAKAAANVTSAVTAEAAAPAAAAADEDDGVEEDAGDIADKEIDIVMTQANVSRNKAIRALKNNKGDIVNSIMELTM